MYENSLAEFVANTLKVDLDVVANEMMSLAYAKQIYFENEFVFLNEYYFIF